MKTNVKGEKTMNIYRKWIPLILMVLGLAFYPTVAEAQTHPNQMRIEARGTNGEEVLTGEKKIRFRLFSSTGTAIWEEIHSPVELDDTGFFTVELGAQNEITLEVITQQKPVIGITIAELNGVFLEETIVDLENLENNTGEEDLIEIQNVPYALKAKWSEFASSIADKAIQPQHLADGNTTGQILQWNGAEWVLTANAAAQSVTYNIIPDRGLQLSDTNEFGLIEGTADGQILQWDSDTNKWILIFENNRNADPTKGTQLSNNTISLIDGTTDGQILKWNATTNTWELSTVEVAQNSITSAEITDGTIQPQDLGNGTQAGQVLEWTGTEWTLTTNATATNTTYNVIANRALQLDESNNFGLIDGTVDGQILQWDTDTDSWVLVFQNRAEGSADGGTQISGNAVTLINGNTDGQVLRWNDQQNKWELGTVDSLIPQNSITSAEIADGTIQPQDLGNGTQAGQVLEWTGTEWALTTNATAVNTTYNVIANRALQLDDSNNFGLINGTVDGQILQWDADTDSWVLVFQNRAEGSADGGTQLSGNAVTLINGNTDGQILKWNEQQNRWELGTVDSLTAATLPVAAGTNVTFENDGNTITINATQLTEAEVDAFVANNGFVTTDNDTTLNIQAGTNINVESDGTNVTINNTLTDTNTTYNVQANQGLQIDGNNNIGLISGTADGQMLQWDQDTDSWILLFQNSFTDTTLNIQAGNNITLSQDGNTVTINATNTQFSAANNGGLALNGTEFSIISGENSGETLVWDAGTNQWTTADAFLRKDADTTFSTGSVLSVANGATLNVQGDLTLGTDTITDLTGPELTVTDGTLRLSSQNANNNQVLVWNNATSQWVPGDLPVDTNTTYNAQTNQGLTLNQNNNFGLIQGNVNGQVLKWNNDLAQWEIGADSGGTSFTADDTKGITLNGTTFALIDGTTDGQVLKWSNNTNSWVTASEDSFDAAANGGLSFNDQDNTFSIMPGLNTGDYLVWDAGEGKWTTSDSILSSIKAGNNVTVANSGSTITINATQLTEAEVDAFVANNGFLTTDTDTTLNILAGTGITVQNDGSNVTINSTITDTNTTYNVQTNQGLQLDGNNNFGLVQGTVDGQILQWDQDTSSWVLLLNNFTDTDTTLDIKAGNNVTVAQSGDTVTINAVQLTEAEVDAFVANNGFLTTDTDTTINVKAGNNVTVAQSGDTVTINAVQLTEAEVDAFVANNGFLTTDTDTTLNILAGTGITVQNDGSNVTINSTITDTNTTYNVQTNQGLQLDGNNNFGLVQGTVDGQILQWDQDTNAWVLLLNNFTDTDTTLDIKAGNNVTVAQSGDTVTINATQLTEAEVDAFVANNGFLTTDTDTTLNILAGTGITVENDGSNVTINSSVVDTNTTLDIKAGNNVTVAQSGDTVTINAVQLTEAEVDAFVANNGFLTTDTDTTINVKAGNNVTVAQSGDTVTINAVQLTEAEVDAFVANNGFLTTDTDTTLNILAGTGINVLNDGTNVTINSTIVDTNTTLNILAGTGITVQNDGSNVTINSSVVDTNTTLDIKAGNNVTVAQSGDTVTINAVQLTEAEVDAFVANNGFLTTDTDTTLNILAGTGINVLNDGTNVTINSTVVDTNTTLNIIAGTGIAVLNDGQTVTINSTITDTDTDTTLNILAGTGITVQNDGTNVTINSSVVDTNTTYNIQTNRGLQLDGNNNFGLVQGTVDGQMLQWDQDTNSWVLLLNNFTDTDTTLDIKAGNNVSVAQSGDTVTINAVQLTEAEVDAFVANNGFLTTDTDTTLNILAGTGITVQNDGSNVTINSSIVDTNTTLDIKAGNNVTIAQSGDTVTINAVQLTEAEVDAFVANNGFLTTDTDTTLNILAGTGITVQNDGTNVTINSSVVDTNTTLNILAGTGVTVQNDGTNVTINSSVVDTDTTLNILAGTNVAFQTNGNTITINATDTTYDAAANGGLALNGTSFSIISGVNSGDALVWDAGESKWTTADAFLRKNANSSVLNGNTLTFNNGSTLDIQGDFTIGTDTITDITGDELTVIGGALRLSSQNATNTQILSWNSANNRWQPSDLPSIVDTDTTLNILAGTGITVQNDGSNVTINSSVVDTNTTLDIKAGNNITVAQSGDTVTINSVQLTEAEVDAFVANNGFLTTDTDTTLNILAGTGITVQNDGTNVTINSSVVDTNTTLNILAGTGVTVQNDGTNVTINSSVVDTDTTLNILAGTNIAFQTNGNTITINATDTTYDADANGGLALNGTSFSIISGVNSGDALVWDAGESKWTTANAFLRKNANSTLDNGAVLTLSNGSTLDVNGQINIGSASFTELLGDEFAIVNDTFRLSSQNATNTQVLSWNTANNRWQPSDLPSIVDTDTTLNILAGTGITVQNDGTNVTINSSVVDTNTTLNILAGTGITVQNDGQTVTINSSITDTNTTYDIQANRGLQLDGSNNFGLVQGNTDGQILQWDQDTNAWVLLLDTDNDTTLNVLAGTGISVLNDGTNVTINSTVVDTNTTLNILAGTGVTVQNDGTNVTINSSVVDTDTTLNILAGTNVAFQTNGNTITINATDTTYDAAANGGLALNGTSFSIISGVNSGDALVWDAAESKWTTADAFLRKNANSSVLNGNTLTFNNGSTLDIQGDFTIGTDTITDITGDELTVIGGALRLSSQNATNTQILSWNSANNRWQPSDLPSIVDTNTTLNILAGTGITVQNDGSNVTINSSVVDTNTTLDIKAGNNITVAQSGDTVTINAVQLTEAEVDAFVANNGFLTTDTDTTLNILAGTGITVQNDGTNVTINSSVVDTNTTLNILAGTGVTVQNDGTNVTINSSVVDTDTTLNILAGTNVAFQTNGNTITINATDTTYDADANGGLALNGTSFSIISGVNSGDALVWDAGESKWTTGNAFLRKNANSTLDSGAVLTLANNSTLDVNGLINIGSASFTELLGHEFAIVNETFRLSSQNATNTQVLSWNSANNRWQPADLPSIVDTDTTLNILAGTGITVQNDGTNVTINSSIVDTNTTLDIKAGNNVTVAQSGDTVTINAVQLTEAEVDAFVANNGFLTTDTDTTLNILAGTGITVQNDGTNVTINSSVVDTNTTLNILAGTGVTVQNDGTNVTINSSVVDTDTTLNILAGTNVAFQTNGNTITINATDTTYDADANGGLALNGTSFSIISGVNSGDALVWDAAESKWTTADAFLRKNANSSVLNGNTLTFNNGSTLDVQGDFTIGTDTITDITGDELTVIGGALRLSSQNATNTQVLSWNTANNRWQPSDLPSIVDTDTTLNILAGTGITVQNDGQTVTINSSITDTNTTYDIQANRGLQLDGSNNFGLVQGNTDGQILQWDQDTNAWVLLLDTDNDTTLNVLAGTGISVLNDGTNVTINSTVVDTNTTLNILAGTGVTVQNDGTNVTINSSVVDTDTTLNILAGTNVAFQTNGNTITINATDTTYDADANGGLALNGTSFSIISGVNSGDALVWDAGESKWTTANAFLRKNANSTLDNGAVLTLSNGSTLDVNGQINIGSASFTELLGDEFAIVNDTFRLSSQNATNTQVLSWSVANNRWQPADLPSIVDTDTTLNILAGTGVTVQNDGTNVTINAVQLTEAEVDAFVANNGFLTTDTDTTLNILAGTGITVQNDGTNVTINSSVVDTNTTLNILAGTGVTVQNDGTNVTINSSVVDTDTTLNILAGTNINVENDGTNVTINASNTTYDAAANGGLALNGTSFSIISGVNSGDALVWDAAESKWTTANAFLRKNANSTLNSGTVLTLANGSTLDVNGQINIGSASFSELLGHEFAIESDTFRLSSQNATNTQVLSWSVANNRWQPADLPSIVDTDTTLNILAGTGVTVQNDGTNVTINSSVVDTNTTLDIKAGNNVTIAQSGDTVTINAVQLTEAEVDAFVANNGFITTDTNTTLNILAGTGITVQNDGSNVTINSSVVDTNTTLNILAGTNINVENDGTNVTINASNTTYDAAANGGLALNGTSFSIISGVNSGDALVWDAAESKWTTADAFLRKNANSSVLNGNTLTFNNGSTLDIQGNFTIGTDTITDITGDELTVIGGALRLSSQNATNTQVLSWSVANNRWQPADLPSIVDTDTTLNILAGTGITVQNDGTNVTINSSVVDTNTTLDIKAGNNVTIAQSGDTVTINAVQLTEAEVDAFVANNGFLTTDTDTTLNILAGTGITVQNDGTNVTINSSVVDTNTTLNILAGTGVTVQNDGTNVTINSSVVDTDTTLNILAGTNVLFQTNGNTITINATDTTYDADANGGLALNGTSFSIISGVNSGDALVWDAAESKWTTADAFLRKNANSSVLNGNTLTFNNGSTLDIQGDFTIGTDTITDITGDELTVIGGALRLSSQNATNTQVLSWSVANNRWQPADLPSIVDTDTTLNILAGTGVTVQNDGTNVTINSSVVDTNTTLDIKAGNNVTIAQSGDTVTINAVQLTEAEVDAFVANNGFITTDTNTTLNILAGTGITVQNDGSNVTINSSVVDTNTTLNILAGTNINVENDGTNVTINASNTTYDAAANGGLALNGTSFSIISGVNSGDALVWDAAESKWTTANAFLRKNANSTLNSGTVLTLANGSTLDVNGQINIGSASFSELLGHEFAIESDTFRLSSQNATNTQVLSWSVANNRWQPADLPSIVDTDTTLNILAGTGITVQNDGTNVTINSSVVDTNTTLDIKAGNNVTIAQSGDTVTINAVQLTEAEVDAFVANNGFITTDTNTTLNILAGTGITVQNDGSNVTINSSVVDTNTTLNILAGTNINVENDGTNVTINASNTTYDAAANGGLALNGTSFSIISGVNSGDALVWDAAESKWTTADAFLRKNANSSVLNGNTLTFNNGSTLDIQGDFTIGTDTITDITGDELTVIGGALRLSSQNATNTQVLSWSVANNRWQPADLPSIVDTDTTLNILAGTGISVLNDGSNVTINSTVVDTNTTLNIIAGTGISVTNDGQNVTINASISDTDTTLNIVAGTNINVENDGTTVTINASNTTYDAAANGGLALNGTNFSIISGVNSGDALVWDAAESKWTTANAFLRKNANSTLDSGAVLTLANNSTLDVNGLINIGSASFTELLGHEFAIVNETFRLSSQNATNTQVLSWSVANNRWQPADLPSIVDTDTTLNILAGTGITVQNDGTNVTINSSVVDTNTTLDIKAGNNVTIAQTGDTVTINAVQLTEAEVDAFVANNGFITTDTNTTLNILAGTGITVQNDGSNVTINSSVVDTNTTLNILAGTNINVENDGTNVTINATNTTYDAATNGGLALNGTDFSIISGVNTGDALVWDAAQSKWTTANAFLRKNANSTLDNGAVLTLSNGSTLDVNGQINIGSASFSELLGDEFAIVNDTFRISSQNATNTQVLSWNSANNKWQPADLPSITDTDTTLNILAGTGISVLNDGTNVTINSTVVDTNTTLNILAGTGVSILNDGVNVTINSTITDTDTDTTLNILAGTGVSILNDGTNVTINSTITDTTVNILAGTGISVLSDGSTITINSTITDTDTDTTLNILAGTGISVLNDGTNVTINSSVVDTDTTLNILAGTGITVAQDGNTVTINGSYTALTNQGIDLTNNTQFGLVAGTASGNTMIWNGGTNTWSPGSIFLRTEASTSVESGNTLGIDNGATLNVAGDLVVSNTGSALFNSGATIESSTTLNVNKISSEESDLIIQTGAGQLEIYTNALDGTSQKVVDIDKGTIGIGRSPLSSRVISIEGYSQFRHDTDDAVEIRGTSSTLGGKLSFGSPGQVYIQEAEDNIFNFHSVGTLHHTADIIELEATNNLSILSHNGNIDIEATSGEFNVTSNGDVTITADNGKVTLAGKNGGVVVTDGTSSVTLVQLIKKSPSTSDFIAFMDENNTNLGALSQHSATITGKELKGVKLESAGADYAEYLPRLHKDESIEGGDIVGVINGKITKDITNAQRIMVVSTMPIVLGNWKGKDQEKLMEPVAFVGQVPVKVLGAVSAGDYIIASGKNDGTGIAIHPTQLQPADLNKIVGQAWEGSNNPALKSINVAITPLDNPAALIQNMQKENDSLRSELDEIKAELEIIKELIKKGASSQK